MKRFILLLLIAALLVGCADGSNSAKEGLSLRQKILAAQGSEFDAVICATYSECTYTFTLHCITDSSGNMTFVVKDPESISGIAGKITDAGGDLRFDDTVLGFDPVADGLLSPVCSPWLFMKTLRGGYLHATQKEDSGTILIFDDTFRSESVQSHIRVDNNLLPVSCEIYWMGKRYLSIDVRNFSIL